MARVEVITEVPGSEPEVLLNEHLPSTVLADAFYADQLVERIGWALIDAEDKETSTLGNR